MDREIRFRAWNRINKNWIYLFLEKHGEVRFEYPVGGSMEEDMEDWLQFTGCHDKNRKEIYERDILKWKSFIFICTWLGRGYGYISVKDGEILDHRFFELEVTEEDFEVIGNVFQNKDLLESVKP